MTKVAENQVITKKEVSKSAKTQEVSKAEQIILDSIKKDAKKESKKETPIKVKFATLYGMKFGAKPNANLRLAVKLFEANKDKENLTFEYLFSEYKKILTRNDYKIDKNTKGRLRRILSRTIVSGIARESVQGLKFNLYANYNGVKIVTSKKFNYNSDFNVSPSEIYDNLYTFKFASKVTRKLKAEMTPTLQKQIEAFKSPKKVNK